MQRRRPRHAKRASATAPLRAIGWLVILGAIGCREHADTPWTASTIAPASVDRTEQTEQARSTARGTVWDPAATGVYTTHVTDPARSTSAGSTHTATSPPPTTDVSAGVPSGADTALGHAF